MDKLFLSVLNMSLTGAFVIVAICFLRIPLKKAPKVISYCLWAVAGFRLVVPFSIESVLSLIPFRAETIPADIAMQEVPHIQSGIASVNSAVSGILPAATPEASINPLQIWIAVGAWIWTLGVVLMLLYSLASYIILKRKMKQSTHLEGNIFAAQTIQSPFVLGFWKPRIYLPTGLTETEKQYILLHEQTHIERKDYLIKCIAFCIVCVHWFNPLVWVAFVLMGADMEMSCDERVLKTLGSDIKKEYSMSLLSLATGKRLVNGSPLAFGEGSVKGRIKNVLRYKKPSLIVIIVAVMLVIAFAIGFGLNKKSKGLGYDTAHVSVTQTYVLENATENEWMERMQSITLHPDGTAELKEALISSYIIPPCTYTFEDGKLLIYADFTEAELEEAFFGVKHQQEIARFTVSSDHALVFQSASVTLFADKGARYVPEGISDLSELPKLKTSYVGAASPVGAIIASLPPVDSEHRQRYFSIGDDYHTGRAPYSVTLYYEPIKGVVNVVEHSKVTTANACILFALIENLQEVNIASRVKPGDELETTSYGGRICIDKADAEAYLQTLGLTWNDLATDWNTAMNTLYATPYYGAFPVLEWFSFASSTDAMESEAKDMAPIMINDMRFHYESSNIYTVGEDENDKTLLFSGMPIWNAYLADLNGDYVQELCATVSEGSGIVDTHIVVYDTVSEKLYTIADRGVYDYELVLEDNGTLCIRQKTWSNQKRIAQGRMLLSEDTLVTFGLMPALSAD